MSTFFGVLIPFIGTSAGAACVFFMSGAVKPDIQKSLLGFASGVMIAASVWSLLLPAIDLSSSMGKLAFVPAVTGFLIGVAFLLWMDHVVPHVHPDQTKPEGMRLALSKNRMLLLAVTLHNIPEGMAVGVVFAGMLADSEAIPLSAAYALAVGIAIQNFPEGAILSMPVFGGSQLQTGMHRRSNRIRRWKAFGVGVLSGIVEPIAAGVTIALSSFLVPVLPYLLSFAAGAMMYVVVEELVPETAEGEPSDCGVIGFAIGFVMMMLLDVTLG